MKNFVLGLVFSSSLALGFAAGLGATSDDLWPLGIVPYEIYPGVDRDKLYAAMSEWESKTDIRFVERTTEDKYVQFVPGAGNVSFATGLGTRGKTVQLMEDVPISVTVHELGHLLGLNHEHQRTDAEKHIDMNLGNVDPKNHDQFDPISRSVNHTKYDPRSQMHYRPYTFSCNGRPVMTSKDPKNPIDRSVTGELSELDIEGLQKMYALQFAARKGKVIPREQRVHSQKRIASATKSKVAESRPVKTNPGCDTACNSMAGDAKKQCYQTCGSSYLLISVARECKRFESRERALMCVSVATGKRFSVLALNACKKIRSESLRLDCLGKIAGKRGSMKAIKACDRLKSAPSTNECLSTVLERVFMPPDISRCGSLKSDREVIDCFKSLPKPKTEWQIMILLKEGEDYRWSPTL